MDMPTPCPNCGDIVEFHDMANHPNEFRVMVCESCHGRIEEENNSGSGTDNYGNTLRWKADPDDGLIEIFVNNEEVVSWAYEYEAEAYFSEFVKIWRCAQAAANKQAKEKPNDPAT
jgi:hypothetical protein